ncbi:MAG: hypothetical protein ACHQNA_08545 [Acidimicrobiales bacterium]
MGGDEVERDASPGRRTELDASEAEARQWRASEVAEVSFDEEGGSKRSRPPANACAASRRGRSGRGDP